jgi:hypothetical protein
MNKKPRLLVAVSLCSLMIIPFTYSKQRIIGPVEQFHVQEQIEAVLQRVDSEDFASQVSTDEFIVNAFQLIKKRNPLPYEF